MSDTTEMKKEEFLKTYRFKSNLEQFKKAVDISKKMIERNELFILFGCLSSINVSVLIDNQYYKDTYGDKIEFDRFIDLVDDEISAIINLYADDDIDDEQGFKEFLASQGLDDDMINKLNSEKVDKQNYVIENLMCDIDLTRNRFKNETINKKVLSINYDCNKYIFEENEEFKYALIKLSVASDLPTQVMPEPIRSTYRQKNPDVEEVDFVCDKQDLDYIIRRLQVIKDRL